MSRTLIDRSPDLQRLLHEGFSLQITDAKFLVLRDVPYVKSDRSIGYGCLATNLDLAGDVTVRPQDHTAKFVGEYPCDRDGQRLHKLAHESRDISLGSGVTAQHSFSRKPPCGYYVDYYEKMTAYLALLGKHVAEIDPSATAKTRRVVEADESAPHWYLDTASSRAEINEAAARLADDAVAIVGLGGTGSYVLDLLAKTLVKEIHLYDGDELLTHNAFRAPGAPSLEQLRARPMKVDHFAAIYSQMHKRITAHPTMVDASNAHQLTGMSFVFLCLESGPAKRAIIEALESSDTPFTDVGMGLYLKRGKIGGILRNVLSLPDRRDQARSRISFAADDAENEYDRNIQIADLNAFNACLAVASWKKLRGFYADMSHERFTSFSVANSLYVKDDVA